jgi:hypothetical protein
MLLCTLYEVERTKQKKMEGKKKDKATQLAASLLASVMLCHGMKHACLTRRTLLHL